jgi:pimeloyl-ACP methyl ester carboxylesterase
MGQFLVDAGFELIAPARPGYQGTALEGRETIDEQADLLAALLDALEIERAALVVWSGGGPSGYRLAVRHRERVASIVASAAVSRAYPKPKASLDSLVMNTRAGNWLTRFMTDHLPRQMVESTLKAEGELTREELKELVAGAMADERKLAVVLAMDRVVGDFSKDRHEGVSNDWVQFGAISSLELEKISAPTLLVHGTADTDVPPAHSEYAAATIPNADLWTMPSGTHLSLFVHPQAEEAQAQAIATLRSGCAASP